MLVNKVVIYSKAHCAYCDRAKQLLDAKEIAFDEIRADLDETVLTELLEKTQWRTFPQIFINDEFIGGFDDLWSLEQKGELNKH